MNSILEFVLSKAPFGIVVYDRNMDVVLNNSKANLFLRRYTMPEEVKSVCRRLLNSALSSSLEESFPGEVSLSVTMEDSPSSWTFKLELDTRDARVCVFIIEDTVSSKLDISRIRSRYRLTRRETDVLRRILDGFRNIEIAADLSIAEQTVKEYLSSVYSKTGTSNRVTLMKTLFIAAFSADTSGPRTVP